MGRENFTWGGISTVKNGTQLESMMSDNESSLIPNRLPVSRSAPLTRRRVSPHITFHSQLERSPVRFLFSYVSHRDLHYYVYYWLPDDRGDKFRACGLL